MPSSIEDALHDEIVRIVTALDLTLGSTVLPVLKRKKPALLEGIDPPPCVFITPSELPGADVPWDTEGNRKRDHLFQVVIATPGNRDNVSDLPEHGGWREAILGAFGPVDCLDAIEEFLMLALLPGPTIDREAVSKLYDYDSVCAINVSVVVEP